MDTPNISPELPVNPSVEKSRVNSPPVQSAPINNAPSSNSNKVDPTQAVKDLAKAVDMLNEALARDPVALRFSIDETLNRPVVTVISEETGEVVHQLPQEEVMRAVKNIDRMRGVLFEDKG